MTRVLITFSMLAKIGWAKPTPQKNPGAASRKMSYFADLINVSDWIERNNLLQYCIEFLMECFF
jgi:hypothetical protein